MKKKIIVFLSVALLALTGCSKEPEIHKRTEFMMDTVMTLKIYDGENEKAMDEAINRLKSIEDTMSAHIETSDLTKINENAGEKAVEVDSELYRIIKKAKDIAEMSDGAYEPSIGPLVDLWDIKEGASKRDSLPSKEDIEKAKSLVDYKKIKLLDGNKVFLEEKGMKLDLGGIVKGYAADEVKDIFEKNNVKSAIIDLGGNVYVVGVKPDGDMWNIGIQDPFDEAQHSGILKMDNQTIVTSGDYERYFEYDGKRYHHIIDSKTGSPSESDISGISIISDNSMEADALSTAVFVLGRTDGEKLLEKFENTEGIFVLNNKEIHVDDKLKDRFELTNKDLKLR